MNTEQLPYILAIAATGSLSAAAKQLGVSQPALSKYLAEQERHAGMKLFEPHRKRLHPTPAGQLYIETAQTILETLQRTRNAIHMQDNSPAETLRLGISPHRGVGILADLYPQFSIRCPQVKLEVVEGYTADLHRKLEQGELDIAMSSGSQNEITEGPVRLYAVNFEELVLAVPSYHRMAAGNTAYALADMPFAELSDFRDAPFVTQAPGSYLYRLTMQLFEQAGVSPIISLATPNVTLQESMIRSGAGVGLIPSFYIRSDGSMAYFRIRQRPGQLAGLLARRDKKLRECERFVLYSLVHNQVQQPFANIVVSEETKGLIREFGPLPEVLQ